MACGCNCMIPIGVFAKSNSTLENILDRLKQLGGNVEAEVLVTLTWENCTDFDLHLYGPDRLSETDGKYKPNDFGHGSISYKAHKGANDTWHTGYLDVDTNAGGCSTSNSIENIAFTDVKQMPDGYYMVSVNNYNDRVAMDHTNNSKKKNYFTLVLAFKEPGGTQFTKVAILNSKFAVDGSNNKNNRNSPSFRDLIRFKVSPGEGDGKSVKITWVNDDGFDVELLNNIVIETNPSGSGASDGASN